MQKPLDPVSVERTETPSASYVLRRRYGPARHVITVASWVAVISLLLQPVAVWAGTVTWDNGGDATSWSNVANWSGDTEPALADDAVLPAGYTGTKTLSNGETANSITVGNNTYTLSGGDLTLGNGSQANAGKIDVYSARTFTINSTLAGASGLTKTSAGTLTLGGTDLLTGGITINAGTVSDGPALAMGNNAITIGASTVLDLKATSGDNYIREFSGSGQIKGYYTSDVIVNSLNDTTFSGTDFEDGNPWGLAKTGPGVLTFTGDLIKLNSRGGVGAQFWRGGTTFGGASGALGYADLNPHINLYGGTVTIDESSADINRVNDAMNVVLVGGNLTFRYKGNASADSAETVGALTKPDSTYGLTVAIDVQPGSSRNAALTFASYGFAPGGNDNEVPVAMVNFATGAGNTMGSDAKVLFTSVPTLWNGVLMGGFVKGTDFATYESATPKGIMAFGSAGSGTTYVNPADVNTPASTDTVLVDANTTTLALTGNKRYNALKIDGARTVNLGGNTLSVGQNSTGGDYSVGLDAMILKTGSGQAEIASTASGGLNNVDRSGNYRQDDYQFYVNEGVLKVTARVLGTTYLRVNKAGPGLLWLAPVANWPATFSAFGSGIYFSEGAIRLDPDSGAFGNQPMVLNGGVMEIEGGGAYNPTFGKGNANFRWQTSGGFAAYGADATFSPSVAWNAANHIPDGAALLLNSTMADKKITLSGTLNLGTSATAMYLREVEVADNTGSTTDLAEISGQIISDTTAGGGGTPTYSYHLVKTGAGMLILSHADNNYSGATYVKAGTLLVNGQLDAPASTTVALNPDYTAVTVMTGGTLGGSGTITRNVRVESGGTLRPGLTGDGTLTLQGCSLTLDGALSVTGNGTTCGKVAVSSGPVVIGAAATLSVSGTVPASGDIVLIEMQGVGTVSGTFSGMPEGTAVPVGGKNYKITYVGGVGNNDVVLKQPPGGTVIMFK